MLGHKMQQKRRGWFSTVNLYTRDIFILFILNNQLKDYIKNIWYETTSIYCFIKVIAEVNI